MYLYALSVGGSGWSPAGRSGVPSTGSALCALSPAFGIRRDSAIQSSRGKSYQCHWLGPPALVPSSHALLYHPFVRAMLTGLQRQLAKPKLHKEPVTTDMLSVWVESLGTSPSLADIRLIAVAFWLSWHSFGMMIELSKVRFCDFQFTSQNMSVHITSSKTARPVSRGGFSACGQISLSYMPSCHDGALLCGGRDRTHF